MPKNGTLRLDSWAEFEKLKNRAKGIPKGLSHDEWLKQYKENNKFHNVICEADSIKFRSKKERRRYLELKAMQLAGECWFLMQVPFRLPGNTKYLLDFLVFWRTGAITFEDTKGKRTPMYIMKKKIVESLYPIKIIEN